MSSCDERQFVPGIYNYCDRWCERCSMSQRCLQYHRESRRDTELRAKGEDPESWDTTWGTVSQTLNEALELLRKQAEEEGIDLDAIAAEPVDLEPVDPSHHPLHVKAHRYAVDAHGFLKKLHEIIAHDLAAISAGTVAATNIEEIEECLEVMTWYHTQITTKISRALCGKMATEEGRSAIGESSMYDANGSAKIAYHGLSRTLDALTRIHEWKESLHGDTIPIMKDIYELINGIDREFPGHRDFKRPGFND